MLAKEEEQQEFQVDLETGLVVVCKSPTSSSSQQQQEHQQNHCPKEEDYHQKKETSKTVNNVDNTVSTCKEEDFSSSCWEDTVNGGGVEMTITFTKDDDNNNSNNNKNKEETYNKNKEETHNEMKISSNNENDKSGNNDIGMDSEDDDFVPPPPSEPLCRQTTSSSAVSTKSVRFLDCNYASSDDDDEDFNKDNDKDKELEEARRSVSIGTTIVDKDAPRCPPRIITTKKAATRTSSISTTGSSNSNSKSILRKSSSIGSSGHDDDDSDDDDGSFICNPNNNDDNESLPREKRKNALGTRGSRGGRRSTVSHLSTRLSQSIDHVSTRVVKKIFGDTYSKKECGFVLLAGALIAFNMGFVNGSCISGFLTPTQTQSVAGFTSSYTRSAMALANGDFETYGYHVCLILSYMFGSFLCGFITPNATPYQIEPTYGPTFMIGGIMLMIASFFAALQFPPQYIFFLAAGANGIQNGIASLYSANLIRCSLTGSSTDVALVIAQCLRGNYSKLWKGLVLLGIIGNFWLGGLLSFYLTRRFLTYTLFFNAVLFWIIGLGLVSFLVHELQISVRAAILGTWEWKKAMDSLSQSIKSEYGDSVGYGRPEESKLFSMFDIIDNDGNGEIDPEELLDALLQANVKINAKGVMVLIKSADANGDGMINRDEWLEIVRKIES